MPQRMLDTWSPIEENLQAYLVEAGVSYTKQCLGRLRGAGVRLFPPPEQDQLALVQEHLAYEPPHSPSALETFPMLARFPTALANIDASLPEAGNEFRRAFRDTLSSAITVGLFHT